MITVTCPRCHLPCYIFDKRAEFTCDCGELVRVGEQSNHPAGIDIGRERGDALRAEMRAEFRRFARRIEALEKLAGEMRDDINMLAGKAGEIARRVDGSVYPFDAARRRAAAGE